MINLEESNNKKRTVLDEKNETIDAKKVKVEINPNKKRMCAILMMYSGVGYFGMQRNTGFKTIEGELFQALLSSNLIDEGSFEMPCKVRFQRASKTDKNVSACGQVCSLKMIDDGNVREILNARLPDNIRILDVFRTTKNFHAKSLCKNRTYRYITPTFAFAPLDVMPDDLFNYRIDSERLQLVNATLSRFKGTHNYHNFTSGRLPTDKSCQRYLVSLECETPFERDGLEYIAIAINGQSFMLHQIRKMVAVAMAVVRGVTDDGVFERAFSSERIDLPRAPGLGLMLARVNYDHYNERHCCNGDADKRPIDWTRYEDEVATFCDKHVYPHIFTAERDERPMWHWLQTLAVHTYAARVTEEVPLPG